jgi:hypothetical protein
MLSTWLRGVGGLLEIAGVLWVVVELFGIRKLYPKEGRGFLGRQWDRIRRRKREHKVALAGVAMGSGSAFAADVETWSDAWNEAKKIDELRDRIAKLQERTAKFRQETREQADRERQDAARRIDEVQVDVRVRTALAPSFSGFGVSRVGCGSAVSAARHRQGRAGSGDGRRPTPVCAFRRAR